MTPHCGLHGGGPNYINLPLPEVLRCKFNKIDCSCMYDNYSTQGRSQGGAQGAFAPPFFRKSGHSLLACKSFLAKKDAYIPVLTSVRVLYSP